MTLNETADQLANAMSRCDEELRLSVAFVAGARVIDAGVQAIGGLAAGLDMARICLAGRAEVTLVPPSEELPLPGIAVATDAPIAACMASQYAGWQVSAGSFFAMGSGPMRAKYGREALFEQIAAYREPQTPVAVGVLETRKTPTPEAIEMLCGKLDLAPERLTLLIAPAASLTGSVQVVARCLETALHKLHELGFDLNRVVSGYGVAPLPPPATDELAAIGRTNDAILYGGRAVVYLRSNDDELAQLAPRVPSSASSDHGSLFAELFARYGDFYKIDPNLFSPAEIVLCNLNSGRSFTAGRREPRLLRSSFGL